jgi:hypothetical protein
MMRLDLRRPPPTIVSTAYPREVLEAALIHPNRLPERLDRY